MSNSVLAAALASLSTEMPNPRSASIDTMSAANIVNLMNSEDATVATAVGRESEAITRAVETVTQVLRGGGRLLYVGAGTSGRLGVVDASEMPPTYGTPPDMVQAIIAGGPNAVFRSQEGAEDSAVQGAADAGGSFALFPGAWAVVGIAASGRTPYVIGALEEAHRRGFPTILVCTNSREAVSGFAPFLDILIAADVGPELVTGSTRMKSGTAQKMILNMITTATMVLLGKTYGNVMVDLQQTNEKLQVRARRIVSILGNVTPEQAGTVLEAAGGYVKTAIVMIRKGCSREEAEAALAKADGFLRRILE